MTCVYCSCRRTAGTGFSRQCCGPARNRFAGRYRWSANRKRKSNGRRRSAPRIFSPFPISRRSQDWEGNEAAERALDEFIAACERASDVPWGISSWPASGIWGAAFSRAGLPLVSQSHLEAGDCGQCPALSHRTAHVCVCAGHAEGGFARSCDRRRMGGHALFCDVARSPATGHSLRRVPAFEALEWPWLLDRRSDDVQHADARRCGGAAAAGGGGQRARAYEDLEFSSDAGNARLCPEELGRQRQPRLVRLSRHSREAACGPDQSCHWAASGPAAEARFSDCVGSLSPAISEISAARISFSASIRRPWRTGAISSWRCTRIPNRRSTIRRRSGRTRSTRLRF